MGYGIQHTQPLPEVGSTPRSEWAEMLVDALDELRTTLDAKVTPAGIDINANLSFRSGANYYAATNLNYAELRTQAALLSAGTYPGVVYKGPDGELYYNNDAGNQVQITDGTGVAAAAGNISGVGYGASGVLISWVAGDLAYEMRSGAGTDDLADIKVDDVYLNDGSGNNLRLAAASMSADYTWTFPAAKPASTSILQMDADGNVTASPSANAATTGTLTAGVLGVTGAATVGGTLGVTGVLTPSAGVTVPADQNIRLSGTGHVSHGTRYLVIPGIMFQSASPTNAHLRTNGRLIHNSAPTTEYYCSIPLLSGPGSGGNSGGVIIRNIQFNAIHTTSTAERQYALQYTAINGTAVTAVETNPDTSSNAVIAVNLTTDHALQNSRNYVLRWRATDQFDTLISVVIQYDV